LSPARAAMAATASRSLQRAPSGARPHSVDALPMAFEPDCTPVHDGHGYAIYAIARPVAGSMFRGWAEIVKDGRRVERSGLIGPRYENPQEAAGYALEWSRRWIAAQSTRATHPGHTAADKPHRAASVAGASGQASNDAQRERAAVPERVEIRRYADAQG
jgi:hypothetical protein